MVRSIHIQDLVIVVRPLVIVIEVETMKSCILVVLVGKIIKTQR